MQIGSDIECRAHFRECSVSADDELCFDCAGSIRALRRDPDYAVSFPQQIRERRAIPQTHTGLLVYRINDGMVCHVRHGHNSPIVRGRQISIINGTEPPATGTAEMKYPDGPGCVRWQ